MRQVMRNYYKLMINEGLFSRHLPFYLDFIFKDILFDNKRMLDVGGGSGLFSFYAACKGAKEVVCLEPEAEGSSEGVNAQFRKLKKKLNLTDRVRLEPITLDRFDSEANRFDIILLHNSINHLNEEACINLQRDSHSVETYRSIFLRLSRLSAQHAKIIIVANSRYNFFPFCNIKNPFVPTIEWHKHQPPKKWAELLFQTGFCNPKIKWISFNRLGSIGRLLFGNSLASYFLNSYFLLTMDKD